MTAVARKSIHVARLDGGGGQIVVTDPEIVYVLRNPELDAVRGDRRFRALEAGIHKTPPPRAQLIAGIAAAF